MIVFLRLVSFPLRKNAAACQSYSLYSEIQFSFLVNCLAALILFLALAQQSEGGIIDDGAFIRIKSRSQQFLVQMKRTGNNATDSQTPSLVAVSCDRIKAAVLKILALPDQWVGNIYVYLQEPNDKNAIPTLSSLPTERLGWSYHITARRDVSNEALIRIVTQAVLHEIANRNAPVGRPAIIPLWMHEGITQRLMHDSLTALVVQASSWTPAEASGLPGAPFYINPENSAASFRKKDPLLEARKFLSESDTMTFQDLSWPENLEEDEAQWNLFKHTAHLFVSELLSLPDGAGCIKRFLRKSSLYLNWQTAFLDGFQAHFSSVLDVEKWWTVTLVQFMTKDQFGSWTLIDSVQKLESILVCNVVETHYRKETITTDSPADGSSNQSGTGSQDLKIKETIPVELSLQTMAFRWGVETQKGFLETKIQQLLALRLRAAMPLRPILDEYIQSIQNHLEVVSQLEKIKSRGVDVAYSEQTEAKKWVAELDTLDQKRDELIRLMEMGLLDGYSAGTMMSSQEEIIYNYSPTPLPAGKENSSASPLENLPEQFRNPPPPRKN